MVIDEKAVFLAALALPDAKEREAYLQEACAGHPEVLGHLRKLLSAHEESQGPLDRRPAPLGVTVDAAHTESSGTIIGPYKLIEPIGEGGMGTVWMAQQTEPVKRLVAVKLIKAGMDSKQVIARFEAERQALALMDHPNIARVLDGGTTRGEPGGVSPGRPYFVMDLVKGVSITRYCDDHHLTPRQRLELFIPVCQAVQHAHQKGIIHRDLKPSNVLVAPYDGKPVVKVIDFGVAKAAGQQLTDRTLVTSFGAIVGTLEYMSPEQAELNNHDIDTRSDIYALGVLLYELLAGSPPFSRTELTQAGMLEMLRVIREQEPSKPSTKLSTADGLPTLAANRGTEPAKLTKLVRGEIDWIVMKALEKDRARRYETANGFALDVQRYLADEPVLACPPSAGYRLRKFARRNKGALAAAGLVLFFLVLLGSGVGWVVRDRSARAAEAVRQQGERQAKVAGQVESIFGEVDRLEKEQKWPEALEAARRAEAAAAGGEADAATAQLVRDHLKDLEFMDRLEQLQMRWTITVEGKFDYSGAAREYARAFRDYGVDVEELAVGTSIDRLKTRPPLVIPLAVALDEWARVRGLASESDPAGWKRLLAIARGIDPEPLRDRVRAIWERQRVLVTPEMQHELRRLAESIDIRAHRPATLHSLARVLQGAQQTDAALRLLRDAQSAYPGDFWLNTQLAYALSTQEDHEGALRFFTAAVCIRPDSATAHNNLGLALRSQNKLDEASAAYQKAIELDPQFGMAYCNLGSNLVQQKKTGEAIVAFRKAIELGFANAHEDLGGALYEQKKLPEAIAAYKRAIDADPTNARAQYGLALALHAEKKLPEAVTAYRKAIQHEPKMANAHYGLGFALYEQNKLAEAIAACHKAIELNPKYADAHNILGNALCRQNKLAEAIDAYNRAIELNPNYAHAYNGLGNALCRQNKLTEAVDAYQHAIKIDPKFTYAYNGLGNALCRQNKLAEAVDTYKHAIAINPRYAGAYNNLGNALLRQNKLTEAIAAYKESVKIDPNRPESRRQLAASHNKQAILLYAMGRLKEAEHDWNQALSINKKLAADFANQPDLENDLTGDLVNLANLRGQQRNWAAAQRLLLEARPHHLAALKANPRNPRYREFYRTYLGTLTMTQAGLLEQEEAVRAAETCRDLGWNAPADAYDAACFLSLCIPIVAKHDKLDAKQRKAAAQFYGDQAMKLLRNAVSKGYKDVAHMQKDTDLDSLRQRQDFQKLVAELQGKRR